MWLVIVLGVVLCVVLYSAGSRTADFIGSSGGLLLVTSQPRRRLRDDCQLGVSGCSLLADGRAGSGKIVYIHMSLHRCGNGFV